MTKRERVIAALQHKETDIIPYHMDFTIPAKNNVDASLKVTELLSNAELHMNYTQYTGWPKERSDKPGYFTDDFGVTWNRSGIDKDIGVIDGVVFQESALSFWPEPALDIKRLRQEYEAMIQENDDRFLFPGIGFSLFERLWSLCGMENALVYMITEPAFVHNLLDKICEYNLQIINIANEYPFDGFYFGDDWGQQRGLIMGPKLWRTFIKPRLKKMYDAVKKGQRFILQHSCGDIHDLFPDLIELGLDCYQTFQPEIYNIESIKEMYGQDLCFWGGISTQQLLAREKPDAVRLECSRTMQIMGRNGGYIAAPTHALTGDISLSNIEAMLEVFMSQKDLKFKSPYPARDQSDG